MSSDDSERRAWREIQATVHRQYDFCLGCGIVIGTRNGTPRAYCNECQHRDDVKRLVKGEWGK